MLDACRRARKDRGHAAPQVRETPFAPRSLNVIAPAASEAHERRRMRSAAAVGHGALAADQRLARREGEAPRLYRYGLYSYGRYRYGLYSYGLYSYGL